MLYVFWCIDWSLTLFEGTLESKILIFMVETPGYDSPRTIIGVLEDDANNCHEAAKNSIINYPQ